MATIAQNSVRSQSGAFLVSQTTLGASDTLSYDAGKGQLLVLNNPTGGSLTVNIDGASATTILPEGYGATLDVSTGYNITIAAGATKAVVLDKISAYLKGTIAITGAAGVVASLYGFAS